MARIRRADLQSALSQVSNQQRFEALKVLLVLLVALPTGSRRYSRLEVCATPGRRPSYGLLGVHQGLEPTRPQRLEGGHRAMVISTTTPAGPSFRWQNWLLLALSLFVFLFLLGSRSLNEPDEGRYAEIAREMLETKDFLVPHIWYVPHLDKPPLVYWAVAASMSAFGRDEWAVRLPLALAGLSGVGAAFLLGRALAGPRAAIWSALLLQSSLLYYVMSRMLTPDILLAQFIAWSLYFFWRAWRSLDSLAAAAESARARAGKRCLVWNLAAWVAMALGFLTKGPIAVIIPLVAVAGLTVYRRHETVRWQFTLLGVLAGLLIFGAMVGPWFSYVFRAVPEAFDFMIKGQALGHALGTTIKNRQGSPFYFIVILLIGFLPWTWLLSWLWRHVHWNRLSEPQKDGWVLLSVEACFTFLMFSMLQAKLPAYILPLFPPLAVLLAVRWFGAPSGSSEAPAHAWAWRLVMISPLLLLAAIPLALRFAYKMVEVPWLWPQCILALVSAVALLVAARLWPWFRCAQVGAGLGLASLALTAYWVPTVETDLRSNQTLKPLALALKNEYRPGDKVVCWAAFPQGLPFYAFPAISRANRPYLCGLPPNQLPFEFPGNRERFGKLLLPNVDALSDLLTGQSRVFVVGYRGVLEWARPLAPHNRLRLIAQVGRWELFANRD